MNKRSAWMLLVLVFLFSVMPVSAAAEPGGALLPRVVDEALLLTAAEEAALLAKVDEISQRQGLDLVIITVESLEGLSATRYADDLYDHTGYGQGAGKDGILFLISPEERDWALSTTGFGIDAFTDAGQAFIMADLLPILKKDDYNKAFNRFADLADQFMTQAQTGKPYDRGHLPKKPLPPVWILYSLAGGALVALIVTGSMKGKLKSVRKSQAAASYLVTDSLNLLDGRDFYLYNVITKTAKEKSQGSSGSSTHTSSSGTRHGGSSGKY